MVDSNRVLEINEIYRRLEAIGIRINELALKQEVLNIQQEAMRSDIEKIEVETASLNKLANKGMGVLLGLTLLGGVIGGFWEKIVKIFNH